MLALYAHASATTTDEPALVGLLDTLDTLATLEHVVDDAKVKKEVSELVGLSAMDEASESGTVLRACDVTDPRTISFAL